MIVVRNVFRLKFGKAKDALSVWKEGREIAKRAGVSGTTRVMTDLAAPFYTLVMENEFASLAEWESESKRMTQQSEWHNWYQKFLPLAESGYREIFTLVE
ncbi:MAG TPA: hypothetical protein VGK86_06655 [Thermoanaerobaculia bacterium]|jgi:hypothetical protein